MRLRTRKNNLIRDLLIEITRSSRVHLKYSNTTEGPSAGLQIFQSRSCGFEKCEGYLSLRFTSSGRNSTTHTDLFLISTNDRAPICHRFVPGEIRPIPSAARSRREIAPIIFYAMRHISQFNPAQEGRDCDAEGRDRECARSLCIRTARYFSAENEPCESDVIA